MTTREQLKNNVKDKHHTHGSGGDAMRAMRKQRLCADTLRQGACTLRDGGEAAAHGGAHGSRTLSPRPWCLHLVVGNTHCGALRCRLATIHTLLQRQDIPPGGIGSDDTLRTLRISDGVFCHL